MMKKYLISIWIIFLMVPFSEATIVMPFPLAQGVAKLLGVLGLTTAGIASVKAQRELFTGSDEESEPEMQTAPSGYEVEIVPSVYETVPSLSQVYDDNNADQMGHEQASPVTALDPLQRDSVKQIDTGSYLSRPAQYALGLLGGTALGAGIGGGLMYGEVHGYIPRIWPTIL